MGWKEFIKPTKGKIFFSIIVVLVWYLYLKSITYLCKTCIPELSCETIWPTLVSTCDCCFTFINFVTQILIVIIAPFIVAYLIYSVISLIIKSKK